MILPSSISYRYVTKQYDLMQVRYSQTDFIQVSKALQVFSLTACVN